MDTAIEIKNVSVTLSEHFKALNKISAQLPAGKIIGFIGPSGAGKTTLIRSIVGRQKLSGGEINILGVPAGSAKLRQQMSYMTQEVSAYPDLTVLQNLKYFATMRGIKRKATKNLIGGLLKTIDMENHSDQLVSKLSGGQKQRVSLAISLIGNPELLILDEPTVGLDPVLREQMWDLFRNLAANGSTLIITSHVMEEAQRCDDLLLIRDGKLLAHDSPEELCKKTGSQTVEQSFLKLVREHR